MKKIAIITGASSGMGKVFAETINTYDTFDEVWVIARRLDRLEALAETVPFPIRPIALDLTDRESFRHYAELLENAQANVQLRLPATRRSPRTSTWWTSTARRSWQCAS